MTQEVEALIARVLIQWRDLEVSPVPLPGMDEFRRFEELHEVSIPADMKAFLSGVGGMEINDWDQHEIRFWRLDELVPLGQEVETLADEHKDYFVFADFLISSHCYAISLDRNAPGQVMRASSGEIEILCETFSDFLRTYLDDPEMLF